MTRNNGERCGRKILEILAAFGDQVASRSIVAHQPERKLQSKQASTKFHEISGPAYGDRHIADGVFEDQVPTDDPRDYFTERCIGIGVGRACDRNHRSQLGVTKRREATGDSSDDERQRNSRAGAGATQNDVPARQPLLNKIQNRRLQARGEGLSGGGSARKNKNPSADDGANADAGKRERPQCALELALGSSRFGYQKIRAFRLEK